MEAATERDGGTLILIVSGRVDAGGADKLSAWAASQVGPADEAVEEVRGEIETWSI